MSVYALKARLEKCVVQTVCCNGGGGAMLAQASLDEPTQSVVMHRTEPSRLQSLALQLAEKMASLVDQNERTMEVKTTGLGYFNYQRPGRPLSSLLCITVATLFFETMPSVVRKNPAAFRTWFYYWML